MATTLKRTYDNRDAIPADIFIEKDGKFVFNPDIEIEGMIPSARLETFRDGNLKMRQRLEAFGDKIQVDAKGNITGFGGGLLDPDKASELLEREQELSDGNLTKKSEVTARVEQRVAEEKRKWDSEKKQLTDQLGDSRGKLRQLTIERTALELAIPFGLRKDEGAKSSLVLAVNTRWNIDENGEPVAYEPDGKTVKFDGHGVPMRGHESLKRDIEKMAKETHKFLFENNEGGGADGSRGSGASRYDDADVNPWDPKSYNRTKQTQLVKTDFEKARRLASKFGVDLKPSSVTKIAQTR